MKKLLLFFAFALFSFGFGQTNYSKFDASAKKIVNDEINKETGVLDFKVDSIRSEKLTKKSLVLELVSFYSKKQEELNDYIKEEKEKAQFLSTADKIQRYEELQNLLLETNMIEKGKVLINKYETADDTKPFIIISRVNYYIMNSSGIDNFTKNVYFKLNGERIPDIYKYYITNQ